MNCPNWRNFVTAHAFLTSWHLFTFFKSYTIIVYFISHTEFLLHLGCFQYCNLCELGAHRFKLEVEDFFFYVVVSSRETFQILAQKFLLCIPQKVFRVYIFPNFVLLQHIVVEKLVKTSSSHRRCSLRKGVLRNFTKFTGKHMCRQLY